MVNNKDIFDSVKVEKLDSAGLQKLVNEAKLNSQKLLKRRFNLNGQP